MQVQPYLFFDGRCDEAIAFYRNALGAEVKMLMRYKDSPVPADQGCPEGTMPPGDKVMHADLRISEARVLVSDGRCGGQPAFDGFSMAITVNTEADADRTFNALADGGKVIAPLSKTFFSPKFGMVADRFGVNWMILVSRPM
jgi:PhnB protein